MVLSELVSKHTSHGEWGEFAARVLENGPNPRQGNKSDEAHPPIHPTKCVTNLSGRFRSPYFICLILFQIFTRVNIFPACAVAMP